MSRPPERRWEYKTVRPPRDESKKEAEDPQSELTAHGEAGWDLAGTIDYSGGGTKFLVFKRPAGAGPASDEGDRE